MREDLERFAETLRGRGSAPETVLLYVREAGRFLEWTRGRALTNPLLQEYVRWCCLEKGWRPSTVRRSVAGILRYWRWRQTWDDRLPAAQPRLPPRDAPQRITPTDGEMEALFRAAAALPARNLAQRFARQRAVTLLACFAYTCCRNNEVRSLCVSDLHLPERRITIRAAKGQRVEWVPVADALLPHLEAWLAVRQEWLADRILPPTARVEAGLWPYNRTSRITEEFVGALFHRLNRAAGIDPARPITPHCIRHWSASWLHRTGVPLAVVSRILRHKRLEVTQAYLHVGEDDLQNAVALFAGWNPAAPVPPRPAGAPPDTRQAAPPRTRRAGPRRTAGPRRPGR